MFQDSWYAQIKKEQPEAAQVKREHPEASAPVNLPTRYTQPESHKRAKWTQGPLTAQELQGKSPFSVHTPRVLKRAKGFRSTVQGFNEISGNV